MAKEKIKCVVRGKILELSPTAYEMAKDYFGAAKVSDLNISSRLNFKPILIPKINVKVEKPEELTRKEPEFESRIDEAPEVEMTVTGLVNDDLTTPTKKVTKPRTKKK
jgi:hypothetical protein